jgi:hypothetical protein
MRTQLTLIVEDEYKLNGASVVIVRETWRTIAVIVLVLGSTLECSICIESRTITTRCRSTPIGNALLISTSSFSVDMPLCPHANWTHSSIPKPTEEKHRFVGTAGGWREVQEYEQALVSL